MLAALLRKAGQSLGRYTGGITPGDDRAHTFTADRGKRMRDLGRLRQGITQRAKEASQQVAAKVANGLGEQGFAGRGPDESAAGTSRAEVTQGSKVAEIGRAHV